jgi:hypothetical protein
MGLATFLLAFGTTACQQNPPPPAPTTPGTALTGTQSFESSFWVTGWSYYLRPIKSGEPTGVDKSQEVWRNLFTGMAKDPKTRELLTRLHGGWPTALLVVDEKQSRDQSAFKAPPPDGVAVALRVANLNRKVVKTKDGAVPFREIAHGRVIRIKDAATTSLPVGKEEPLPEEALGLAIEEYVLRHAPGWIVRLGTGPATHFDDDQQLRRSAEEAKLPASVEDQRRELERRIRDHEEQAKALYGAIRKP